MPEIDHFLFAGSDLTLLSDIVRNHGLRAVTGGRHLDHGTHNALIGLESGCYLELIAPDPAGDPEGPRRKVIQGLATPQLLGWCLRVRGADAFARRAEELGLSAKVVAGERSTATGKLLRWQAIGVTGHGFGGVLPSFLDWLDTPHPTAELAAQARLIALTLEHPDPQGLHDLLAALAGSPGVLPIKGVSCTKAQTPGLRARFATPGGEFELRGGGAT